MWASLTLGLAMGYTIFFLKHPNCHEDPVKHRGHLQNALVTIPRLVLGAPSLTGVQVLFGMVSILKIYSPSPCLYN
jgi:hypothetical protein